MSSRAPFPVYLFDVDGTLLDSIALISPALEHTLHAHQRDVPADDAWHSSFGMPLRTQFAQVARDSAEVEAMISTYRAYYVAHHDQCVRPYPGIKDALAALHRLAVKLAIVTSKGRQGTERGLRACVLEEYFNAIVTVDDTTEHKPHPAPVVEALDRLSAKAHEAVFVGDSPYDLQSGRAAGIRTAAALWGPFTWERLSPHRPTIGSLIRARSSRH